jgi:hypothetical protein
MIDYNHNMGGVDLKHQFLHMYMVESKKMTKWYLKIVYRQVMGRNIQQLLYRIQLVEGLFMKYACAYETQSVLGWQASDNTVPWLTERHLRTVAPQTEQLKPQRRCVVCLKYGKKKTSVYCCQYVMWAFAWKTASRCITRSSLTEVMTIILLHLCSFKISVLKF